MNIFLCGKFNVHLVACDDKKEGGERKQVRKWKGKDLGGGGRRVLCLCSRLVFVGWITTRC